MAEYIEREALISKFERIGLGESSLMEKAFALGVYAVIETFPAADVAPVVHGRWDGDTCTACKLPWKYNMVQNADDWGYFDPMPDYCPNCGAKMDGGDENAAD